MQYKICMHRTAYWYAVHDRFTCTCACEQLIRASVRCMHCTCTSAIALHVRTVELTTMELDHDHESMFLEFAEASIEHIRLVYSECDEDTRKDLFELAEQVLQYLVILGDVTDSDLFAAVRDLVAIMAEDEDVAMVRRRGRPDVCIDKDQLQYLIEQGFKIKDISDMFKCSRRTIERKMKYNIVFRNYAPLSDPELETIVHEITSLFPNCGEKSVSGRLKSRRILIQRERVRDLCAKSILLVRGPDVEVSCIVEDIQSQHQMPFGI